jgi:hypothetical protein
MDRSLTTGSHNDLSFITSSDPHSILGVVELSLHEDLVKTLLVFVSTPIKPGGVHRLMPGREFESRLIEAHIIGSSAISAYVKGRSLASGKIDVKGLSLGKLIGESLKTSYEATGMKPLIGLHAASITLAALLGYHGSGDLRSRLSGLLNVILYRGSSEDSIELYRALEATAASEYLLELSKAGISATSIMLRGITLGDLYEALSKLDTGFWLNLRMYSSILRVVSSLEGSESLSEASVKSYLAMLPIFGVNIKRGGLRELMEAEKELRRRGFDGSKVMGGAFAATSIYTLSSREPLGV